MATATTTVDWRAKRRRTFRSVFQTEITQPTPYATPLVRFPDQGQPFGGPLAAAAQGGPARTAALLATDLHGIRTLDTHPARDSLAPGPPQSGSSSFLAPTAPAPALPPGGLADDQLRYDHAWHVVTSRIALPASVSAEDSFGTLAPESQYHSQDASAEADFQAALRLALFSKSLLPDATHTEDILDWQTQQVRQHFVQHVLPMLSACSAEVDEIAAARSEEGDVGVENARYYEQHMAAVTSSVRTLEAAMRLYFYGLSLIVRGLRRQGDMPSNMPEGPEAVLSRFRRDVHALVGNSVSTSLMRSIQIITARLAGAALGIHNGARNGASSAAALSKASAKLNRPQPPDDDDARAQAARQHLHELVDSLTRVGLAGERFQVLFAEMMDKMMDDFVKLSFAGLWTSSDDKRDSLFGAPRSRLAASPCIAALYDWVENHFARLIVEVLSRMSDGAEAAVDLSDVKRWKEVALGRLSTLRIAELFDIVLSWPAGRGGREDLRASVTTPERRAQLISAFSSTVQKRLLHPGRSTLDILRVYISMIRTFHVLDQSHVLLAGAVGPLQLYLCQRDDAVRIVITGLLASREEVAEAEDESSGIKSRKLIELAALLDDPSQQRRQPQEDDDLDWNDMEWLPDPVDAGANYKRPKSEDVIGTIISALGSQDVFVKEFQNIIAERLLSARPDFTQESEVLYLLKKRFGEAALQNCDVMIRDIQESKRLDGAIRRAQRIASSATSPGVGAVATEPKYQARILSRLFWPQLGTESFLLPREVADLQKRYEDGYEHLKEGRKLSWLHHLGQASVELELQDRTITVDCHTYEAAVIYAFQQPEGADSKISGSVDDLVSLLQMDEDLVRAALFFWVRKGVLRAINGGEAFVVVETQSDDGPPEDAPLAAAAPDTPRRAHHGLDEAEKSRRTMYWQYIVGMLTNSASSMPLAQIAMIMKMLAPDGFPVSNEELQEMLGEKVGEGALEVVGGKYKLVKK
jgi:anaphase-promoting complex subunit 2